MCNLIFFHPGDLALSDWFWILLTFISYSFITLLPFILGGIAIFVLRNKKKK